MEHRDLLQKHSEKLAKIKELNRIEETRSLDDKESAQLDLLFNECQTLKEKIEKRERLRDIELQDYKTSLDIPKSEERTFSLAKAVSGILGGKLDGGYEREVGQAISEKRMKHGIENFGENSVFIPASEVLPVSEKRIVNSPAALIQKTLRGDQYIDSTILHEASFLDQLGVQRLSANGKFSIPRAATVITSSYFSGSGGSTADDKISVSTPTFDSIDFEPHLLSAATEWTRKTLLDMMGSPDLEGLLRKDLMESINAQMFDDFLVNAGTGNKKPVKGILNLIPGTSNTAVDLRAQKKWTTDILEGIEEDLLDNLKGHDTKNFKWLFSRQDRKLLRTTLKTETDTSSNFLWDKMNDTVIGKPAYSTGHLTTNAIYGDFSQAYIATFGSLELEIGWQNDQILRGAKTLVGLLPWSIGSDLRRPEAFQKMTITRT